MKKIRIISVGSLSPLFRQLYKEYENSVKKFCLLETVEIKEFSQIKNIQEKKQKETEKIKSFLTSNEKVIIFSLKGKQINSEKFSQIINSIEQITFIIGGSDGIDEDLFDDKNKISFSQMTFPHQLFKIMLTEQIYRAFMIIKNKKYHK
ncbi:23S rRNA (pseudouridine(1915)-N(3))-methyltransferase RlmH [Mycoplasmopsis meleagridis]|uniref:23S rRNA (pseudouridine(1915)-N(3))-methyltransferase RlmH n=1 Tax=Mycoplasmopsis meleagridis TaxID=29561 RepID=UPI00073D7E93|nr:23S rRNA (pseudouridine(1915)-N(3))-methyltransferase RlmH [Mycoplasmopsis meleagridis]KUH47645.1 50S rRNA methyltransferase [Mycoplasmopsis meleagridis]